MSEKHQQAVAQYLSHHSTAASLHAIAKLLIYAHEHKEHIHLSPTDTDALKGTIELLKELT
jgi:hypothetical protein